MDVDLLAALRSAPGEAALARAAEVSGGDPLAGAAAMRADGVPPELAAAALTQVQLRRRAVAKFGPDAALMFFTRAGLEQATRAVVADRRADRLRAAGVGRLLDLGCGLGADALAAARAGILVDAVEADPTTAAVAAANAAVLGLADRVRVRCADATTVEATGYDAVFCDPARRQGGRRVFDPTSYSPPWDFVVGLADRVPRTVLKLAPGIDHARIPAGAEAEWVSVAGEVVEAAFWCGPLAAVPRRATLLAAPTAPEGSVAPPGRDAPPDPAAELTGPGTRAAPVGPVRRYLYDPDGAVVRAGLVAEFAETIGGSLADSRIAYVYADRSVPTPFGRGFEVLDVAPFSVKRLRTALRERGIGRLEIRKRGAAVEPDQLRRELRLAGPHGATLVVTRVADAHTALLCAPRTAEPSDRVRPAGQGDRRRDQA
ncbi:MAG TPA: methyltransferase domain-containing protein [Pilimelia sp.]|nr:methyltransferase domain-containing protein [Pilimelia sp.]